MVRRSSPYGNYYPSAGESAATGLERGVSIGRGMREDVERRSEKEQEFGLRQRHQDTIEQEQLFQRGRQQRVDQWAEEDRQLKAVSDEVAGARDAFGALYQSGVRDQSLTDAGAKLEQLGQQQSAMRRKRYAPEWQQATDQSKALLNDLKTRRKSPEDIPEPQLYTAMSVALKRPVSELFRGEDGTPSQLGQAADQLVESMQSGDQRSMLQAANVVFAPELRVGTGEVGRGGAEILKKEIVAANGDPRGNGKVMPTLLVTAKLPNGKEVQYHAPITEGRASHAHDDNVVSLDVGDVMDQVARIQAAEKVVNSPDAAEYLRRGEKEALPDVDRYLQAYHAAGGKEIKPKEIKTEQIAQGNQITRIKTEPGGKETREVFPVGLAPKAELDADTKYAMAELRAAARANAGGSAGAPGAEEKRLRIITDYAKKNNISIEDAAKKLRDLSVLGVQSPEERATTEEAKREAVAKDRDVAAAQRAAPGTSPAQVRLETELKAKALRDKSMPAGAKLGKYVVGKGLQVMDEKGKQVGWYKE